MISRSEWHGDAQTFRELDRNRDGVLSGNEVPAGRERRKNTERIYRDSRDRAEPRAGRLDENKSGVVEGYEWPYNRAVFHRLDRDRDSVLSPEELDNIDAATLTELDRNRDGKVDSNEWPGGFAKFERLDNDRDGRVSADEYFERGGEWRRRQRFDAWDTNRDGIIQSTEWKSDAKLFHRLDTDQDSTVTWEEFRSDTERYLSPPMRIR
jgi:Ca2+-binding EF-hand superfamily protein